MKASSCALLITIFACTFYVANCRSVRDHRNNVTAVFTNPIIDGDSADPAIIRIGDYSYLTFTLWDRVAIFQSPVMTDFRNRPSKEIFRAPAGYGDVWAPEFHVLDGELYIYFCMAGEGKDNRLYVLKADDISNPMGSWSAPVRILPDFDAWSIDATVMFHGNGRRYLVWVSTMGNNPLSLWIAEMLSPYDISPNRVLLRVPQAEWECYDGCVNEGPNFIYSRGVSYLIFSASSTWGPNYSLGMMSITADKDPLIPSNWWFGPPGPVFYRNDAEGVYTTGHAAFTLSPDGTETWMAYHATVDTGRTDRIARLERIDFNDDGSPRFPRPHGFGNPIEVPHGQA